MNRKVEAVDLANTSTAYHAAATMAPGAGRLLHVSGQPGSTVDGVVPGDYESQIHLALLNLHRIIVTAGSSVADIAKLVLLIVGYDPRNRLHARHVQRFLRGHRPAITLIPAQQLAQPSWLFEVEAVVAVPASPRLALPDPVPAAGGGQESVDVVVIGAGLAGLTAARHVIRAGFSCVVLEARDRVGGKTWSVPVDGDGGQTRIDLGAAWINDTNQSRVYGLAKEFGVDLIQQNTSGAAVVQDSHGTCLPFPYGDLPKFDDAVRQQLAEMRDTVEADCQKVDTWKPQDATLDSLTFEAYLRSKGAGDAAISTATVWTRAMLGQEPCDISALYFLNYCKSGGGLIQMRSDRRDGAQYLRVRQGTQSFSQGLASTLPDKTIRLNQPVRRVTQQQQQHIGTSGSVLVQTDTGTISGRKLVTTIPGPALGSIEFQPPLPPSKRLWLASLRYGYYTKAMMQFRTPFWAEQGFCGLAQSFTGPASVIRDTSIPADDKFVLTCFMSGEPGMAWAALPTAADREAKLLEQLAQIFSSHDAARRDFVRMATYEWSRDDWSGQGCPCTSLGPGVLSALGGDAFRQPCGDLHFAGTETAGEWKGYMEGAVRSGERVASEVVEALSVASTCRL